MLEAREVGYEYRGSGAPALRGATLAVAGGERVAVLGANGAGKSTLARLLNGSASPSSGVVALDGSPAAAGELSRAVGLVRQDPRSQIVSAAVLDEVAFGPRNLGLPREEVLGRVRGALGACGLTDLVGRGCSELSGGQQQRLALAGVIAMRPSHVVLDEALAQLDEGARARLGEVLAGLARDGVGVAAVTHRLEEVAGCDRAVVLESGATAWEGSVDELLAGGADLVRRAGLTCDGLERALPALAAPGLADALAEGPGAVADLVRRRGAAREVLAALPRPASPRGPAGTTPGLALAGARVCYGTMPALDDVSATFPPGRVTLVAGVSGSGKTTMARLLAGVLEPDGGEASLGGRPVRAGSVGLAFQRPEDQLFCDTVLDDVAFGPRASGLSEGESLARARSACRRLGVPDDLLARHPLALSGGQRRLVALAGIVALDAGAYVFDEPTAGLDAEASAHARTLARDLAREGRAVVVVSHEVGEWLACADYVVLLRDGAACWAGTAAEAVADPSALEAAGLAVPLWVALARELGGGAR